MLGAGGNLYSKRAPWKMTEEEIRTELEYLERILDSIESWTLRQAAKARIERLREELKRRGVLKP
jgi:hypothetical protein